MPPERWSWLGEPLAIDFANTVRRRGSDYTELLASGADLRAWAAHEANRVPDPPPAPPTRAWSRSASCATRSSRCCWRPRAPAGADRHREAVNAALAAVPLVPQLRDGAVELVAPADTDPVDELLARTAISALELLPSPRSPTATPRAAASSFIR